MFAVWNIITLLSIFKTKYFTTMCRKHISPESGSLFREWRLRLRRPRAWRAGGGPPSPVGSPAELLSPLSSPFPPSFPRPLCLTCMACPGGALAHSLFFCNYLSYFTNMILDSCRLPAAKAVLAAPSPGLPHADRRLLRALLPFILVCLPSPWLPCLSQRELLIMP